MKKITKLFALALSSVFAMSIFAACGGNEDDGGNKGNDQNQNNSDEGNPDQPDKPSLPELPTPESTVLSFTDQDVTLTVDGETKTRNAISDSLFGVFLEDINYAGYLLDDNLIPNGSFETFNGNKGWLWTTAGATLAVTSGDGVLKDEQYYGAQNVNANYASLNVTAAGGSLASVGHPQLPIALEKDVDYIFSAFIKAAADVEMTVTLKGANATYAEQKVSVKGGDKWIKYQATLTSNETVSEGVTFAISFDEKGTYALDGIQLETANATGGIKQYVYDAIKELGPKFIRFPGGCIIEGDGGNGGADTQEVYDWKNSVGAVQTGTNAGDDDIPAFTYTLVKDGKESEVTTHGEWITRRQNEDLWSNDKFMNPAYSGGHDYDMEYGVGFYEYFLLCDSLGASAVPVLNCGLSCMGGAASASQFLNGRHDQKVNDYIQDAVNLIEFARGDRSTKWGKIRAALGHEEPFAMDYIGIGNEQSGEYYTKYYEKFLQNADFKAALAKYNIKPIVGNGMFITDCQNGTTRGTAQIAATEAKENGIVDTVYNYGVHDQHYYVNWTTLLDHYNMYDNYDRITDRSGKEKAYGVFVGEYSANEGITGFPEHQNQLITALGEAAMMTSYERNGNVVELAAYAPMFGVANKGQNPLVGGDDNANQWDVDMMYYTNTKIVRTANYYVQQMFMHNQGAYYLSGTKAAWTGEEIFTFPGSSTTFNKLYYVTSRAENGDLLIKVINISGEAVKMNVNVTNATSRGFAYVTELTNADYKALNTLKNEAVKPTETSVGWEGQGFGYAFKPYSLTILRIPTEA